MERLEIVAATPEHLNQIATLTPDNPFLTVAYAEAQRRLGSLVWIFVLYDHSVVRAAALGFMRVGRLRRTLTIPSSPALPPASAFWSGLAAFVKRERVTYLELESYAAPGVLPPPLAGERERFVREEFLLNLDAPNISANFSATHRRLIRRGARSELVLRRSSAPDARAAHIAMSQSSAERRRLRGEGSSSLERDQAPLAMAIETGAAELYQAMMHDTAVSSVAVLRAPQGAYLISAGTSEAGRECGASHWLVHEIACVLGLEGVSVFNLGGARQEEPGLRAYKIGFGATPVSMEWVSAEAGSAWGRGVLAAIDTVRSFANRVRAIGDR